MHGPAVQRTRTSLTRAPLPKLLVPLTTDVSLPNPIDASDHNVPVLNHDVLHRHVRS